MIAAHTAPYVSYPVTTDHYRVYEPAWNLAKGPRKDSYRYCKGEEGNDGKPDVGLQPSFCQSEQSDAKRDFAQDDGGNRYGKSGCTVIRDALKMGKVD